ncbi:MAG: type IV pili methyl-accepting chemotaxis transducer N-terminal domain-containing protein [Pseudomonadota bacterium]
MPARLSTAAAVAVALGLSTLPVPLTATAITSAQDGKTKINVSGRNRMLSQRMAKAVCFAAIDVDTSAHLKMAASAHAQFDKALAGLRHGDTDLGILPENAPAILVELDGVDDLWATYGGAIAEIETASDITPSALSDVASLNLPTLVQMNKAVGAFEQRYGASDLHPALALAINVSGRQRMLSQKSSKEFCLVVAGQSVSENREALAATVALFESSLLALMDGSEDLGLPEAPTDEIYDQLQRVQALWAPVAEVFKSVAAGGTPTAQQIKFVADQNNKILAEMHKAVGMYAAL